MGDRQTKYVNFALLELFCLGSALVQIVLHTLAKSH